MTVLETISISVLTTLGTASIAYFFYYLRMRMKEKSQSKTELEKNKRESLKRMLDSHSEILFNKHHYPEWHENFSAMSKDILLWGSDKILEEYGNYVEKKHKQEPIMDYEKHFANAILAYRKELGYKNRLKKITPEHIVLIFRSGYRGNI